MKTLSTFETEEEIFQPNPKKDKAAIMVHTRKIMEKQHRRDDYEFVDCVTYFQCSRCNNWCYKSKCKIACGHWHMLRLTHEERDAFLKNEKTASINILDHLHELVPNQVNDKIGLVTFQNGINNSYEDDFDKMGKEIKNHLNPEQPLCIGLYNTSGKIIIDLFRMQCEFFGCRTEVVRSTRKIFSTIVSRLKKNYSHPSWLHIAHSEGGRIAHDTLKGLSYETNAYCQKHLIVHTYGSIQPIAKDAGKEVSNFYASHDIAYRQYGNHYEKNNYFKIVLIASKKIPFIPIPGDHGFLGTTYREVLEENMTSLRKGGRFYNAKN